MFPVYLQPVLTRCFCTLNQRCHHPFIKPFQMQILLYSKCLAILALPFIFRKLLCFQFHRCYRQLLPPHIRHLFPIQEPLPCELPFLITFVIRNLCFFQPHNLRPHAPCIHAFLRFMFLSASVPLSPEAVPASVQAPPVPTPPYPSVSLLHYMGCPGASSM